MYLGQAEGGWWTTVEKVVSSAADAFSKIYPAATGKYPSPYPQTVYGSYPPGTIGLEPRPPSVYGTQAYDWQVQQQRTTTNYMPLVLLAGGGFLLTRVLARRRST